MRQTLLAALALLCASADADAGQHRNADGTISDDVLLQSNGQIIGPSTPLPVAQPDLRATGTMPAGTLNATYVVALNNGEGVVGFKVSGLTGSGATLVPEVSNDGGTTWASANALVPASPNLTQALTGDQQFRVNAGGHTHVRLRVSVAGSGTLAVASTASLGDPLVALSSPATVLPATGTLADSAVTQQSLTGLTALEVRASEAASLGEWFAQNQSGASLVIVLCNDGGSATPCVSRAGTYLVAPGAGSGQQGASLGWQDTGPWKGRIDVYAAASSAQHTLTRQ